MLDSSLVRERIDEVLRRLRARGGTPELDLEPYLALEQRRRELIRTVEDLKRQQNVANEQIARTKRAGEDPSGVYEANRARAQRIKELDTELGDVEQQRQDLLLRIPNLPHETVPEGRTAADN